MRGASGLHVLRQGSRGEHDTRLYLSRLNSGRGFGEAGFFGECRGSLGQRGMLREAIRPQRAYDHARIQQ